MGLVQRSIVSLNSRGVRPSTDALLGTQLHPALSVKKVKLNYDSKTFYRGGRVPTHVSEMDKIRAWRDDGR